MPFYTYECPVCDQVEQCMRKVADRHVLPFCPKCALPMEFKITPTQIAAVHGAGSGTGHSKVTSTPPK